MLAWITPPTQQAIPNELIHADSLSRRRMLIDRYRSRTEVTNDHITTAFAWLRLPTIVNNELVNNVFKNEYTMYKTIAVPRGVEEQQAADAVKDTVYTTIHREKPLNIITLNTGTAAAASNCIKGFFDSSDLWTELDVKTLVTSSATHKIHMYKYVLENSTTYVILNNLDTPGVIFKIATAIMLDLNVFGNDTEKFANAWLNGNADTVYNVVTDYYAEYKRNKTIAERMIAIEALSKSMVTDREQEFKRRIEGIEGEIESLMGSIRSYTNQMNIVKGEYLLYKLEDDTKKTEELKAFFKSIGDKLIHVSYHDYKLRIVYRTKLVYYEPELLKRYFDSTRTNCVNTAPNYMQALLKDIFLNNKYNLLIESGAIIYIRDNNVGYMPPENVVTENLVGMPNPHHKYYNCWGDNKPNIINALVQKDCITAISQVFAAMSGLNISDTAVMERFVKEELVEYSHVPCLENKETGEVITVADYGRRFEDASDEANE